MKLDVAFARSQFPAFQDPGLQDWAFFENAGGSYACVDTTDQLGRFYTQTKVQPYSPYPASSQAGEQMDRAHARWAEALSVNTDEVLFGPSTSANTYVLANALASILVPGDEVVVTNQDHEANTGALRRVTERSGATLREWRIDPETGLLDTEQLNGLLNSKTRLVAFPHSSNIIGQENDVARICEMAHSVGAWTLVDGVSYVPHSIPDVGALGADIYLFSLYKVYSVHQGLMVIRAELMADLPNQGHYFNDELAWYRMAPAGPDHAQVAASGGVLDYVERLDRHHFPGKDDGLRMSCERVSSLWRSHEDVLLGPVLDALSSNPLVRLLGPAVLDAGHDGSHRCPTVAFQVLNQDPAAVAQGLVERGIMASSGHYYAVRVLTGVGVDVDPGVVRVSWVHYTNEAEVEGMLSALSEVLD